GPLADGATDAATDAHADASPDAAVAPPGVQCFTEWQRTPNCAAPSITAAYLTQNCAGTTGIFVVGSGFESANLFDINNGWMAHGPRALPTQLNRDSWNVLTPTFVCITTNADPSYWTGWQMQVRNPDGQLSNSVTVTNQLSARPPLPTTDSIDPFDPDACLEGGMTQQEALTHFAPGASTATIGTLAIVSHTRACNAATGCQAWTAPTAVSSTPIGLAIANAGAVDLTLDGSDCGRLGASDYTLTYNSCGAYEVHVAAHCLMLSRTQRTSVANDGSYSQTDTGAVLRF
ncbi:MAG: hypothetical protein JO257_26155, partial [Deltaproteobacteria bacterium]|nr:hypothetical protein [Deltaproteobacteria bacterium]